MCIVYTCIWIYVIASSWRLIIMLGTVINAEDFYGRHFKLSRIGWDKQICILNLLFLLFLFDFFVERYKCFELGDSFFEILIVLRLVKYHESIFCSSNVDT
jgi:hypothetical protein